MGAPGGGGGTKTAFDQKGVRPGDPRGTPAAVRWWAPLA
eukprot:SAG31_NODE_15739_length_740_cov_2.124805_1_plen_38_part_10